jgi:hypothetical protein
LIDELDLVAYLTSKGLQVHRAAGNEVTVHCIFCADGDPKGKGKLYLNTESWLWDCKRCGATGNRKVLLEHFGDEDAIQHAAGSDPMLKRRLLTEAAELAHEMLLANEKKLSYLLDRGIHPDLIISQKLGYVPKNVGLSEMLPSRSSLKGYVDLQAAGLITLGGREFFSDSITIPYFSHGTVIQIREKNIDGKYRTTGGDVARLYNGDALFGADRVLITEGEFDSLAVRSQIIESGDRWFEGLAVVGLPGAGSWPDGFVEMLGQARKVFIGLDPDDTGEKFAKKLKEEVGNRARIVNLPGGEPKTDWTDYFLPRTAKNPNGGHDWRDLKSLLIEADLAGKQLFNIADISTKWQRHRKLAPGLKLGWPSLDTVIRPGLRPGQVMIPLAKSGTGKTVFLSNIAHNLHKHRVLYVSLEMTAAEVYEHLRRIHHFWNPAAGHDQLLEDYERLHVVERNRVGRGDLGDFVNEYAELVGDAPEVIIVDYLQYYARAFRGGTPYERASDAVMELKAVGKDAACSLIVPSQVNRGAEHGKPISADDARDSGVVEETGDFLISLFRPDQVVDKQSATGELPMQTGDFRGQILKSRHGGKGRTFSFKMSLLSLAIVDSSPLGDRIASSKVDQENSLYRQGIHYEDYRREQLNDASAVPLWEGA